ncbi:MAG: hypothetical protein N3E40_00080 [Dehalococcoidia bacterium]|nr:hypothetical protein [Dehalococcoidia bacterium]
MTRDQIIMAAFLDMGLYAPGETPTVEEYNNAALRLNMMIKAWQAAGVGLWLLREATLFYVPGQGTYRLGAGGDRFALDAGHTTLAVAANAGASQVTVASTSGMVTGSYIGICTSPIAIQWFTVSGISGSVVTLSDSLTTGAPVGSKVHFYTTTSPRPLDVVEARDCGDYELQIYRISYDDYQRVPAKTITGRPNQFCYIPTLGTGTLYLWPISDSVERWLELSIRLPIQIFETANDNPEFPSEWFNALHFGLARELSPMFGVPPERYALILSEAERALDAANGFDRERGVSIWLAPELRR